MDHSHCAGLGSSAGDLVSEASASDGDADKLTCAQPVALVSAAAARPKSLVRRHIRVTAGADILQ